MATDEIPSVSANRLHRGRARNLVGRPLWDALDGLARAEVDVNCGFRVHIRAYGKQRGHWLDHQFRVVGLWDDTRRAYSLYVTNAPERFSPADVAQVYRLRWEVETYDKTGKSGFGLDEPHSSKSLIVRTLVKAALIRASIAMQAKRKAEPNLAAKQWTNPMQRVQVWRDAVETVRGAIIAGVRLPLARQPTWESLATPARDSNINRPPTRWKSLQEPRVQHAGNARLFSLPDRGCLIRSLHGWA